MEVLTGWRHVFGDEAVSVVLNRRYRQSKKIGGAMVTIWERKAETGTDFQLLLRASTANGKSNETPWLSASRECHTLTKLRGDVISSHDISPPICVVSR